MLTIVKKNDSYDAITYQLENEDNSTVDLTGASVNFVMGKKNKLITNAKATVTSATSGIVSYQLTPLDTLVSGTFLAEFVVTFANGTTKTYPSNGYITVDVEQNLDTSQANVVVDMIAEKQGDFTSKLNSILLQAGNINMSAMNEYSWTATEGQLIFIFPSSVNYTPSTKWFQVSVGNVPVDNTLVNRSYDNQFALNIDSSNIKAGMTVRAMWVEPITPVVPNSYKIIPQQDLPPVDAGEGDLWFDTSDNTYQGTIFDNLNSQLAEKATDLTARAINVKYPFGTGLASAKGDGSNETTILQAIINYASQNKLNVYFPTGTFIADKLIPHSYSHWIGAGENTTVLQASVSSEIGFIKMEDIGPVQRWSMRGFTVIGQGSLNPNQNGLHFNAIPQATPSYTGGLWYCDFFQLTIRGFNGSQIYLNCVDGSGDMANQFLTFMNVKAFREDVSTSRCLKASGQFGQVTFIQCEFDGKNQTTLGAINVELRSLATGNDQVYSVKFDTCTFQSSDQAIYTYNVLAVTLDTCYFEKLNTGINCDSASYVTLNTPRFANITNAGNGYCIQSSNASHVVANSIYSIGTIDKVVKINGVAYLDYTILSGGSTSSGVTIQMSQDVNGAINTGHAKTLLISTGASHLKTISNNLAVNATITLIAWGSTGTTLLLDNSGNIMFPEGKSLLTIPFKGAVTIQKIDLGGTWVVISTTGTFS
jgi:hypothetical protein